LYNADRYIQSIIRRLGGLSTVPLAEVDRCYAIVESLVPANAEVNRPARTSAKIILVCQYYCFFFFFLIGKS
jgi:hypothetical protein